MHKRTLKVALLVTLAIIMVFGLSTVAFASAWPDLPASVTAKYAITGDQVAGISDGFANGLWKPYINVSREQFVKMAVAAFKIPLANPATATYSDVPKGSFYYQYIEGATAAGMTNGFGGATFKPGDPITREQAIAIVVRWVAKVNGYNLATQYTAAQITALLAPFPDAAAVNLKPEVAFAIDFGITVGNAYGKLDPASNMTRIQGAAFLIRAITMIPAIPVKVSKLEIVSGDKGENLIGQNHMVTFKATKADGTPAVGALVDFDTLVGPEFMVGNISPQAAMTDKFGQVTVNLIATEPGTENVSASVPGLAAVVATKYWLALDEVYTIAANDGFMSSDGSATPVQNNAGTTHDWSVRVTVFGPGPLSTSPQYWYNAITTAPVDPTNLKPTDAIDASYVYGTYDWSYSFEKALALNGYVPRTLAGVTVNWSILPLLPTMTSTGVVITNASGVTITSLTPGAGVAAGGTSVVITGTGFTGATAVHFGIVPATSYVVNSATRITAIAPAGIVNTTVYVMVTTPTGTNLGYGADQYTYGVAPVGTISAITNSGTIATGGQTASGPTDANGLSMITITSNKTGLTATQAVATYAGNPYPGDLFSHRTFSNLNHHLDWEPQPSVTQLKQWIPHTLPVSTGPLSLASSKDNTGEDELATLTLVDVLGNFIPGYQVEWTVQGVGILKNAQTVTDVTGKATATLYSSEPGQSILEAKVLDKSGTPAYVYTATKQWYQIDSVAFTPASLWALNPNGTLAVGTPVSNVVNNPHTFNLKVSGLKWVWTSTDVNNTGLHDNQALVISRDSAFNAAGTIINEDGTLGAAKPASQDLPVQTVMQVTIGNGTFYVTRFADATLQPGEYWANMMNTPVIGVQLLWSGLAGKGVYFFNNIGDADATSAAENFGAPVSNTSITPPLLFGDTRTV